MMNVSEFAVIIHNLNFLDTRSRPPRRDPENDDEDAADADDEGEGAEEERDDGAEGDQAKDNVYIKMVENILETLPQYCLGCTDASLSISTNNLDALADLIAWMQFLECQSAMQPVFRGTTSMPGGTA